MTATITAQSIWGADVDDAVVAVAAARDGRIAVVGAEGSLTLLSADGEVATRQVVSPGCLAVSWSPTGDRVAVGSIDGFSVFDTEAQQITAHRGGWCSALAWSFDGARLAAGVGRSVVVASADGTQLMRRDRDSTVTGVAWIKSRVAAAAYGGVHVYHVSDSTAADILPFTGSLLALVISPDRRWAASGNQDATLHVWRVGRQGQELEMSGYPTKITTLAFSPDSTLLASGGGPNVTVWDFRGSGPKGSSPRVLSAHEKVVTGLAWSPDGTVLASSGDDGLVAAWKPSAAVPGRPVGATKLWTDPAPATTVTWSPAGAVVAGWANGVVAGHEVRG